MNRIVACVARFLHAEDGPTAVEYAAMLLLVILACLSAINMFGEKTAASFQDSSSSISTAIGP